MNDIAQAIMATGFFVTLIVTVKSIASVWNKRLEMRRGSLPGDAVERRLENIETAVDAIALEVERIAEAQRYTIRLAEERDAGRLSGRPAQLQEGRINTPH